MSGWQKREPRWTWRQYLSEQEAELVATYENAKATAAILAAEKSAIQNRAIHRAKYAATHPKTEDRHDGR